MKTISSQPLFVFRFPRFGYLLCLALGWAMACSSSDEAPGGGRIAHPVEPSPKTSAPTAAPPPSAPIPIPSPSASPAPSANELPPDPYLSPLDKAIANDHPSRPWSKNVPKRSCTKDDECGDGFCDRGRCAAIWTGGESYGQKCGRDERCAAVYLCLDGRCRSCVSDDECVDEPDNQNPRCKSDPSVPGARGCRGVAGSGEGNAVPSPFRSAPKK